MTDLAAIVAEGERLQAAIAATDALAAWDAAASGAGEKEKP